MDRMHMDKQRQKRLLTAFLCGFLGTLAVHAFGLLNHELLHDQVRNVFSIPATYQLGRWLLDWALEIGTRLSMPWFNGLMLALTLGLTSAVAADLLELKRFGAVCFTALLLCAYPSVTESILFIHVVDCYGLAIFLAVLAVWITDARPWGAPIGIVLLTCSMGIYQAYWPIALALCTLRGLQLLLRGRLTDREVLLRVLRYALLLALSVAAYLAVAKLVMSRNQGALSDYMGVSSMGQIQLKNVGHLLKTAYLQWIERFVTAPFSSYGLLAGLANCLLLAFDLFAVLLLTLRRKRGWLQTLGIIGITAMLPLLFNGVYLMGSSSVHSLMVLSIACTYWLAPMLMEEMRATEALALPKARRAASAVAMLAMAVTVFTFTVSANQIYYIKSLDYEATSQFASRVLYRIESREDFTLDTPVLFVGSVHSNQYGTIAFYKKDMPRFETTKPFDALSSDSHIRAFIRSYLGVRLTEPNAETAAAINQSDAVAKMPAYPAQGCIAEIDGVLVVKVGD